MAEIKLTLQNRITTLLVLASIFFIATFTFIQINNQLDSINRYNSYRINLASIITKNNLEATLRQASIQDAPKYLEASLKELKEGDIIKQAVIYDREGKIISSIANLPNKESIHYRDINKIEELEKLAKENKWFLTEINNLTHSIDIYIGLKLENNGPVSYVAKLSFNLGNIQEALIGVYRPIIFVTIIIILANIILGYILSTTVIGPIKMLNQVTKIIASGDLTVRARIQSNDELQELGLTFNYMTEELIKMKERAENANPLTKLPGNIVIHEEVERRIKEKGKFLVIYCDLDNFKAFNDKYGIAMGDEAIKLTANILKEAVKTKGNPDDFIGHEGGDDFILLTTLDKGQAIADYVISELDKRIRNLYNQEDLSRGYVIAHARDGAIKQFPIMTISLAGVTNDYRQITSYGQVTNIAAEVKEKVKDIGGSAFIIDKRKT